MKLHAALLALCSVVVLSTACASGAMSSGGEDGDMITTEQIRESSAANAYELVQSLHPRWLRKRGQQSLQNEGDIVVYFDNARMGGPETLRGIPLNTIGSVQFFNAAAANYRWGAGHSHGVILVSAQGSG